MAWEWSHTGDAYDNARANLERLPVDELRVIWSEWQALCVGHTDDDDLAAPDHCEECYEAAMREATTLTADALANAIWDRMSEQALCDNGGFHAWACPHGCHTVSFDASDEEE